MNISITSIQDDLTDRLDELETSLPTLPSKSLAFGRASTRRVIDTASDIVCTVSRRFDTVRDSAVTSTKTSTGQASAGVSRTAKVAKDTARETVGQAAAAVDRTAKVARDTANQTVGQATSAVKRTTKTAQDAARQTAGQARAEAAQTIEAAADAAEQLIDDGTQAVDPDRPNPGVPYARWTKAQLYDRAQELDIEGRSTMNKKQLVAALRA